MADWKYFTERELQCRGSGECNMDEGFMEKLILLREDFGKPLVVTSGYRSKDYNISINGSQNSAHLYGRAVDVLINGTEAYRLVKMALDRGFTGLGVSQKGAMQGRFIHLDDMPSSDKHTRPLIWSY